MQRRTRNRRISRPKCLFLIFTGAIVSCYFGLVSLLLANGPDPNVQISKNVAAMYRKPLLTDYIQGWNITGNVSWLLDFSIVGFPKTGTSTLMVYLENQTESVFMFSDERCEMGWNQHVPLLVDLWKNYQPHLKMGIKCPRDLEIDLALLNYNQFLPSTKFIVGIRNPVLWFQSFYNFRVNNEFEMPPAERLIGRCKRTHQGVCTNRANFSKHLQKIEPWRKVFIYDVAQLQDANVERARQFRRDLTTFLDLKVPLHGPMIHVKPGHDAATPERANELAAMKINICDERYASVRKVLWQQGSQSASWIENVFLASPNVMVSSPDYFSELLASWHHDPCNNSTRAKL